MIKTPSDIYIHLLLNVHTLFLLWYTLELSLNRYPFGIHPLLLISVLWFYNIYRYPNRLLLHRGYMYVRNMTAIWQVHIYESMLTINEKQNYEYSEDFNFTSIFQQDSLLGPFTLVKTAVFKFAVFCLTIYTCPKNHELSAGTKLSRFFG